MPKIITPFEFLPFLSVGLAFAIMAGCSGMNYDPGEHKMDVSHYKPILLPETNRRMLPNIIREKISPANLDAIERSSIVVHSPRSNAKFSVKFETMFDKHIDQIEVNCESLSSGLLRCSKTSISNYNLHKRVQQGVYAFGGLVPLYVAFYGKREVSPWNVEGLRFPNEETPVLPSPGFDLVRDLRLGDDLSPYLIQCIPATDIREVPSALKNFGPVSFIACREASPPTGSRNSTYVEAFPGLYNPGLPRGNLFLWIKSKGIALPAQLFFPNSLTGNQFSTFIHSLWGQLHGQNLTKMSITMDGVTIDWSQRK